MQPSHIASSTKASRVPEVGGGPRTSISTSGKSGVDLVPGGVGVVGPLAVDRHLRAERQVDLFQRQVPREIVVARDGDRQTVRTDAGFGDVGHTALDAELVFRRLHAARGAGDVSEILADTAAEDLHATARAGRFDDRRGETGVVRELLRDRLGVGEHGGRTDAANFFARCSSSSRDRNDRDHCRGKLEMRHDFSIGFLSGTPGVLDALPIRAP